MFVCWAVTWEKTQLNSHLKYLKNLLETQSADGEASIRFLMQQAVRTKLPQDFPDGGPAQPVRLAEVSLHEPLARQQLLLDDLFLDVLIDVVFSHANHFVYQVYNQSQMIGRRKATVQPYPRHALFRNA